MKIKNSIKHIAVASLFLPTLALAGPGLTLGEGKLNLTGTVELGMSKDNAGKPLSLAPDVSYGVTNDLTVMLVHSSFLTTGFRGAAGSSLCLSGTTDGCAKVYDHVGLEALYGVQAGPFAIALNGGVHALSLDGGFYAAKLGAKLRYTVDKLAAVSSPSVFIGMTERDSNKESLWIPVALSYKVAPAAALGVASGIKGPLDGFGDKWTTSLGAFGTYAVSPTATVGGSWTFGKIIGGVPDAAKGPDFRVIQLWLSYTM